MAEMLNDKEMETLVMALAHGMQKTGGRNGSGAFNETDAEIVEKWAREIRLGQIALDLVLAGKVMLAIETGEVKLIARPE